MDITQITKLTKSAGATRATEISGVAGVTGVTGAIGTTAFIGDVGASGGAKIAIEECGEEEEKQGLGPPEPGFQAVILCGPGTSLYPFTGVEELLPKALLPIANKPMIQYSLEWCQKARFKSILILTLAEHFVAIQSYINSQIFPLNIQVEAPSTLDENMGTADVLRRAYREGWLRGDIVVLPCDLVTDLDPDELVKIWMVENAGFDCDMGKRNMVTSNCREDDERRGGLGIWYDVRGEGQVKGQETDFLALAPHREPSVGSTPESQFSGVLKTLLYNLPGQEFINQEEYPFRTSLFRKCPNAQINLTVRDSGIYFLPFWILRFIDKNSKMNSIREDVLPWWSKARWQNRRLAKKMGLLDILSNGGDTFEQRLNLAEMSSTRKRDITQWTQQDVIVQRVYSSFDLEVLEKLKRGVAVSKKQVVPELSTANIEPPPLPLPPAPPGGTKIPPIIVFLPESSGNLTRRVDTVHLYLSMCLYMASPAFKSDQIKIHPSASIDRTAKISRLDCLIAAKVSIAGKAFIKSSVLGFGVSIGRGAKVLGSVLMDGASVAEGASVEGCILGKNVIIGADAKLKNCKVAPGLFVEPGNETVGEILTAFNGMHNGNTSAQFGSERNDGFLSGSKDQYNQEQSELDGSFSGSEPAHKTMEGNVKIQKCVEDHENGEDTKSHEDVEDNGNIEGHQGHQDHQDHEDSKDCENIKGREKGEDQKAEIGGKGRNQIKKAKAIIIKTPDDSMENNDSDQGYLGDLKADENKMSESDHKHEKENHLKKNQELRLSPEARLVRRDSSETEALYKEAATKQDIKNAFSSSPKVDQSHVVTTQSGSKVASPTSTPSTSKKISGLGWSTWGLSILTLGIWFAFFTAVCNVVQRSGNIF